MMRAISRFITIVVANLLLGVAASSVYARTYIQDYTHGQRERVHPHHHHYPMTYGMNAYSPYNTYPTYPVVTMQEYAMPSSGVHCIPMRGSRVEQMNSAWGRSYNEQYQGCPMGYVPVMIAPSPTYVVPATPVYVVPSPRVIVPVSPRVNIDLRF